MEEPVSEERPRYIRADFNDKTQMERIATEYPARFDIIIFDWATAHNFYNLIEIVPLFKDMLKMGGKLVLDPSFHPSTPLTDIKTHSIERLANPPTYSVVRDVINEVYIKNKMYRESASTIENEKIVTFHNTSLCYTIAKPA
jgi:hypothetical protein